MNMDDFDALCAPLPGATLAVQWGDSHVYKVGGKIFAMAGQEGPGAMLSVIFKSTEITSHALRETKLARTPTYLPRGNWLEVSASQTGNVDLSAHIRDAHRMVLQGLPMKVRSAIGSGSSST